MSLDLWYEIFLFFLFLLHGHVEGVEECIVECLVELVVEKWVELFQKVVLEFLAQYTVDVVGEEFLELLLYVGLED